MKVLNLLVAGLFLGGSMLFVSCEKDDDNDMPDDPGQMSITQTAADAHFSILVAALQRTGLDAVLDDAGTYTVFAPTDDAFTSLLGALNVSNLDELSAAVGGDDALANILLYHVLNVEVMSTDLSTGWVSTMGVRTAGEMDYLSAFADVSNGAMINGANIDVVDIECSNGVIHVIDQVILPMNLVEMATMDSRLSILVTAVGAANPAVAARLSSDAETTTVFAPTDDAFASLLEELQLTDVNALVAALGVDGLTDVLLYHALNGNARAADVMSQNYTTLQGEEITVDIDNTTITDANGRVSNIVITDIQGTNGVVHVLDKVILPQQ